MSVFIHPRHFNWPVKEETDSRCVAQWGLDHIDDSKILPDPIGNNDGTLKDRTYPVIIDGPTSKSMEFDGVASGGSRVEITGPLSFANIPLITVSGWVRPLSAGEANLGYIFDIGDRTILYNTSPNQRPSLLVKRATQNTQYNFPTNSTVYGDWTHLLTGVRRDIPTAPVCIINGNAVTPSVVTAGSGSYQTELTNMMFGNNHTAPMIRAFHGQMADFRIYNDILTVTEAKERYLLGALKPLIYHHRESWPVVDTSVSSGMVGPWWVMAGQSKYLDDGTYRGPVCTADQTRLVIPSNQRHGTWYFRIKLPPDVGMNVGVFFMCEETSRPSPSPGNTGYFIFFEKTPNQRIRVLRYSNGSVLQSLYDSPNDAITPTNEYEFLVNRNRAAAPGGTFCHEFWIRGAPEYTTWTKLTTAYNSIYDTSNYIMLFMNTGMEIKDFQTFLGPFAPNDHPYLVD